MVLRRDGIQCNFLIIGVAVQRLLFLGVAESPALDARDRIEHRSTNDDAHPHHVERVVVAL